MRNQWFWLLVVVAGATVLYSYVELAEEPSHDPGNSEITPDFIAYQLTRQSFDADGNLNGHVAAAQMMHFEQLGQIQFDQPAYTLFENRAPRWQVQSLQGVFYQDNKVILEQQVRVNNLHPNEMFQQIQTEQLEMAVDTQIMKTDLPVTIIGQNFDIHGSGLRADLVKQTLRLYKHQGTVYRHETK